MKFHNLRKALCVVLAAVICLGAMAFQTENTVLARGGSYNEPTVRVGMYVDSGMLDTRMYSSKNTSSTGAFEVGYSSGGFNSILTLNQKDIILLPQINSVFDSASLSCKMGDGNVGAYSAVMSRHASYSEAASVANSMGGFVAVVNGGFEVRKFSASSVAEVTELSGGKPVSVPNNGGIIILDTNGKILLTYEDTSRRLAVRAVGGGSVSFPHKHRSGKINNFDYIGYFEYCVSGAKLMMINCIGLESYTKCVMANEIGTNVSVETRKAFSVLARTVPLHKKHGNDFNVCCNSACCQVYSGVHRMSDENNAIVDSTRGLICTYEGSPISVLYHNSNGGASCSSVAAWGGDEVPYLTTVFIEEAGETDVWTHEFTEEEFSKYIRSRYAFSSLRGSDISMKILETDPYGSDYITVLSVSDGNGNNVIVENAEAIRSACGFDSANFDLEYSSEMQVITADGTVQTVRVDGVATKDGYEKFDGFGDSYKTTAGVEVAPTKVTVNGQGVGHGVGFSAIGSEQLAKDGYSYEYIISFFFNGTKLTYAR